MLDFAGEENFPQTQTEIWNRLIDTHFLARCIPGLEHVDKTEPRLLAFRVRPGLSFLKGTLKTTLEIFDEQEPNALRIRVQSKGIGSTANVETEVKLLAVESGTLLTWTAEVKELGGLLKPVGRSLVAAAAKKVIADGWIGFRNAITS